LAVLEAPLRLRDPSGGRQGCAWPTRCRQRRAIISVSPSSQRRVSKVPESSTVFQALPSHALTTKVVLPSEAATSVGRRGRAACTRAWQLNLGTLADAHIGGEHAPIQHL